MSRPIRYFLRNPVVLRNLCAFLATLEINAEHPWVVEIKAVTRSLEQNAKFHAICGDFEKQGTYMGRTLTLAQWKVLFISGHAIATGLGADLVPGIEGEFVNIRESSAQMSVKRMASLIEYVTAYAVGQGIELSDGKDSYYHAA